MKSGNHSTCGTLMGLLLTFLLTSCSSLESTCEKQQDKYTVASYYLPKPYVQVELYEESFGTSNSRIHVRVQGFSVADTSQQYFLKLDHSHWVRDEVRVDLTPEGLLNHLTYDRFPRQADAVVAIGRAALKAASMVVGGPMKGDGSPPEFARLVQREIYKVNEGNWECTYPELSGGCRKFTVTILNLKETAQCCGKSNAPSRPAFFYRPLIPVKVTVKENTGSKPDAPPMNISGVVYVPDPAQDAVMSLQLDRGTIAHQRYDFSFAGGVLSLAQVS